MRRGCRQLVNEPGHLVHLSLVDDEESPFSSSHPREEPVDVVDFVVGRVVADAEGEETHRGDNGVHSETL